MARFMLCEAMLRGREGSRNRGRDFARLYRGGAGASSAGAARSEGVGSSSDVDSGKCYSEKVECYRFKIDLRNRFITLRF